MASEERLIGPRSLKQTLAIAGGQPVVPPGLHTAWPIIGESELRAAHTVLRRGVLSSAHGPEVVSLQKEWAWYCGVKHCLATSSGTSALHCAMVAAGVDAGDEVIVPAVTFAATAFAPAYQGAHPVFCDIDSRSYNIDPRKVEALITERTRAIVVVHLHGLPADMAEIKAVADRHGIAVLEDAAQAHGATYRGARTGSLARGAAFSLNATKTLVGGEGGLFVTDDSDAYRAVRRLAMCGEDVERKGDRFRPSYLAHSLGWNYRCSELTAAVARQALRRLNDVNQQAMRNAEILNEALAGVPGVITPTVPPDRTCTYHKYRFRLDPAALGMDRSVFRERKCRNRFLLALQAEGVEASTWYEQPLPAMPAFRMPRLRPSLGATLKATSRETLTSWDPNQFPEASRLLDESLILGSERSPICAQRDELMPLYVEAVKKVVDQVSALMDLPDQHFA